MPYIILIRDYKFSPILEHFDTFPSASVIKRGFFGVACSIGVLNRTLGHWNNLFLLFWFGPKHGSVPPLLSTPPVMLIKPVKCVMTSSLPPEGPSFSA